MAEIAYFTARFAGDVLRHLHRLPLLLIVAAGAALLAALAVTLPVLISVAVLTRIAYVTYRIFCFITDHHRKGVTPSWTR